MKENKISLPPYNMSNNQEPLPTDREMEFKELDFMINCLTIFKPDNEPLLASRTTRRIEAVIEGLVRKLFPGEEYQDLIEPEPEFDIEFIDEDEPLLVMDHVVDTVKDYTPTEGEIDIAAQVEIEYIDYSTMEKLIYSTPGLMAAREEWDNGLNQEYIIFQPGVGVSKVFNTVKKDDYKYVRHTYKSNKQDKNAEDWYIINPEFIND